MTQYKLGFYEAGRLVGVLPEEGFIEDKTAAADLLDELTRNKDFVRIAGQNVWFDGVYVVVGEPPPFKPKSFVRAQEREKPLPPLFMRKRIEEKEEK